jgi:pimeloyl-ACP methyl ester carboxylesterase
MSTGRPAAFWFGHEESPLFGTLHAPEVPQRGVIVLCPPLGREYAYTHATFVQLAIRLTQLGFAALRFDYRSTGDSFDRIAGDSDSHGFEKDVRTAVEFARSLGADHVGVVGMRLGANFISRLHHLDPVDATVLWDPCPTGKSFLREQRALALFAGLRVTDENTHALDLPGFKVAPEMAEEILRMDLIAGEPGSAETGGLSDKVLLLTRAERAADRKLVERFSRPHVEWREVAGQPQLLDVHDDWPVVPAEGLATVASWLDEIMPRSGSAVTAPSLSEVTVAISPDGPSSVRVPAGTTSPVRERTVRLGPAGLFGIETESVTGGSGPVCIFVSVANEHRIGPGRLWVQLSRRLALEGFRCARFDVNGFGDSPARDGQSCQTVYSVSAIDDVVDAARALSPDDPGDVLLFGLCSSAYQILEAALSLSPRAVCSLNPVVNFRPPEMAEGGEMDPRRRFCSPTKKPSGEHHESRTVALLKRRLPTFASMLAIIQQAGLLRWRSLNGRLRDGPGKRVVELAQAGTDVLLICGPYEFRRLIEAGLSTGRRGNRRPHLQVEVFPTLDHGLFPAKDREQVTRLILAQVISEFQRSRVRSEPGVPLSSHVKAGT